MKLGLPVGISTSFWFIIGFIREITEKIGKATSDKQQATSSAKTSEVAVLLPAHNEESVINDCIKALRYSFKPEQIYVASDGSVDNTTMLAKKEGCNVIGFVPGIGKARALVSLIEDFNLYKRYKFIFIIDADTRID